MLQYEVDFYNQFSKLSRKLTQDNEFIQFDKKLVKASAIESLEIITFKDGTGRIYARTSGNEYGSAAMKLDDLEKEYKKIVDILKKV